MKMLNMYKIDFHLVTPDNEVCHHCDSLTVAARNFEEVYKAAQQMTKRRNNKNETYYIDSIVYQGEISTVRKISKAVKDE